ncbi:Similar to DDB1-and CUL4-associated factor 4; acc. no. Q8WV16 [Pyronema omphalodes CBS 100304]|uniref:Similar to DDB1-and CUL4-associated factor 4 acc. no. Q8WV16 n=1 Tax=Pyronema omphalodes (strain CBS 100304) TaxID=1076935 RepID=U4L2D5_PYROM|nr:Similar to DDB1-and CUL4-associated factor 4; acc. no. Q8WV16 [Pyronema omphalodes CBS 100304]
MQPPREIPGFYYDPEKKKYFKILPHHAAPTAAFHTNTSIAEKNREKRRIEDLNSLTLHRAKRTRRTPLKANPCIRATLYRELTGDRSAEAIRSIYARGLQRKVVWEADPGVKLSAFTTHTQADGTEFCIIGTVAGDVRLSPLVKKKEGELQVNMRESDQIIHGRSQISSVSVNSQGLVMATFMGGPNRPPAIYCHWHPSTSSDILHPGPALFGFNRNHNITSVWTSAASPNPQGDLVLGTNQGAVHIEVRPWNLEQTFQPIKSDVFAVSFLPNDPNPYLTGSRDGDIRIFDIRAGRDNRPVVMFRHGGPVTHIRNLAQNRIIVNGLQRCASYDLRYPHKKGPSANFGATSRAMRDYGQVGGEGSSLGLGFDVDVKRGLMVVAQQDGWVNLRSLETGEKIPSPLAKNRWDGLCKGLRFDEGEVARVWGIEQRWVVAFDY